jgi:hypothetical protein
MTPDQLQQMMNQQMQTIVSAMPFGAKAIMLLQILCWLVTVICLPLITWKLFSRAKPNAAQAFADDERLREIRARREAVEKLTVQHEAPANATDDDVRYKPPQ